MYTFFWLKFLPQYGRAFAISAAKWENNGAADIYEGLFLSLLFFFFLFSPPKVVVAYTLSFRFFSLVQLRVFHDIQYDICDGAS